MHAPATAGAQHRLDGDRELSLELEAARFAAIATSAPLLARHWASGDLERELLRNAVERPSAPRRLEHAYALVDLGAAGATTTAASRASPFALTPSERRITEQAAAGASNPEIAQALVVTVKTVEMHLGNVYRKLGVASRQRRP